jgi:hypothetical protein
MSAANAAAPTTSSSSIGACLSGSFRTFAEPCVGPHLAQHVFVPLRAHVYAFMNELPDRVNDSYQVARHILQKVDVRVLHIGTANPSEGHQGPWMSNCSDGRGSNNGYAQSRGFLQCATHMLPMGYTWVFRLRPDIFFPFSFHGGLPREESLGNWPRGFVLSNWVANCDCGKLGGWSVKSTCTTSSLCAASGDAYALMFGRAAQRAYLAGYAEDFDKCSRKASKCSASKRANTPEEKLGSSIACRATPSFDVRWLWNTNRPVAVLKVNERAAPTQVSCRSQVSAANRDSVVMPFQPSVFHHLVPGWWDLDAQRAQKAECQKPPKLRGASASGQRAETWKHLCL